MGCLFMVTRGFSPARVAERRAAGRDILPRIAPRSHGSAAREKFCQTKAVSVGRHPKHGVLFCVSRGFSPARAAERRAAGRDILPRIAPRSYGSAAREKFCQIKAVSVGRHPKHGVLFCVPRGFSPARAALQCEKNPHGETFDFFGKAKKRCHGRSYFSKKSKSYNKK